jgi:hypothetical protein
VVDWSDYLDESRFSETANRSWMRAYIAAGLIGMGTFGVIGGMLHILPV